jgi:phage portal protein BeeE
VAVLPGQYPNSGWLPQGVLLRHYDTFKLGARITGYLDSTFTSGVPSGYLSVSTPNFGQPIEDPDNPGQTIGEQVLLKREWMAAHGTGRRSVAVLNSSVAYTPIQLSPVDSEVAKVYTASRVNVAHAFGMSSVWLDEGMSGLSYSNSSERRADLVSMTAAGWGEKLCSLVQSLLPYGSSVSVNWPNFISPSTETLMPALVQAVTAGILAPTEARQLLGFTPWTGPDMAFQKHLESNDYEPPPQLEATPPPPEEATP